MGWRALMSSRAAAFRQQPSPARWQLVKLSVQGAGFISLRTQNWTSMQHLPKLANWRRMVSFVSSRLSHFMTLPTRYRARPGLRSAQVIGLRRSAIRQSARYGFANATSPAAIETHKICGVDVPIYSPAKSIADAFRNPKLVDRSVAIESLKSALADRIATPAKLFEAAREFGAANIIKPYLEALTANG